MRRAVSTAPGWPACVHLARVRRGPVHVVGAELEGSPAATLRLGAAPAGGRAREHRAQVLPRVGRGRGLVEQAGDDARDQSRGRPARAGGHRRSRAAGWTCPCRSDPPARCGRRCAIRGRAARVGSRPPDHGGREAGGSRCRAGRCEIHACTPPRARRVGHLDALELAARASSGAGGVALCAGRSRRPDEPVGFVLPFGPSRAGGGLTTDLPRAALQPRALGQRSHRRASRACRSGGARDRRRSRSSCRRTRTRAGVNGSSSTNRFTVLSRNVAVCETTTMPPQNPATKVSSRSSASASRSFVGSSSRRRRTAPGRSRRVRHGFVAHPTGDPSARRARGSPARRHRRRARLEVVAAEPVDVLERVGVALDRREVLGHRRGSGLEPRGRLATPVRRARKAPRVSSSAFGLLVEQADGHGWPGARSTIPRLEFDPGQDPQQGRLADAVGAEQADLDPGPTVSETSSSTTSPPWDSRWNER